MLGGTVYTWLGSTRMPFLASTTGILVRLPNSSAARLFCVGCRCWMTTKAMPLSTGMVSKKVRIASKPPADAPIAAMHGARSGAFAS